jgi:hypothetical protein
MVSQFKQYNVIVIERFEKIEDFKLKKKNFNFCFFFKLIKNYFQEKIYYEKIICKKKFYDWKVIKKRLQGSPKKHSQKSHPKKIFSKINKKFIGQKKTYILSKKCMSKIIFQKSLKTKKKQTIYSYALACFTK